MHTCHDYYIFSCFFSLSPSCRCAGWSWRETQFSSFFYRTISQSPLFLESALSVDAWRKLGYFHCSVIGSELFALETRSLNSRGRLWKLDLSSFSRASAAHWQELNPLPTPRCEPAIVVSNNALVVVGGLLSMFFPLLAINGVLFLFWMNKELLPLLYQ